MRFSGVLLVRASKSDMRSDFNQRWSLRFFLRLLNGCVDRFKIIAVFHSLDMPAVCFKSLADILGECQFRIAINADVVIIVKVNDVPKLEMRCK